MEDPNVQEQMQRLLEDPDNLADAIENDSELRTLRDSNPLCAELVSITQHSNTHILLGRSSTRRSRSTVLFVSEIAAISL